MKVQFFSGKTIAWIQREVVCFYNRFKAQKLKYSILSLLFLLVCGGFYIQGLRYGYLRGYFLKQKIGSILSANNDMAALKALAKNDYDNIERGLEIDLDSQIQSIFWIDYPLYTPWYLLHESIRTKEEQIESWENAISRIAVYRKTHPSESKWLEPYIEKLMTYLPPDSIEDMKLDSSSITVKRD